MDKPNSKRAGRSVALRIVLSRLEEGAGVLEERNRVGCGASYGEDLQETWSSCARRVLLAFSLSVLSRCPSRRCCNYPVEHLES